MRRSLEFYPKLVKEFNYKKNNSLLPKDISRGSDRKIWWKCLKGHEWLASPNNRTKIKKKNGKIFNGTNCPYCSGLKVTPNKTLKKLRPEICKEWHKSKNGKLKPDNFGEFSNIKVWWECLKGHEWKTRIADRSAGKNCPKCFNQSSKPEFRILSEFEKLFKDVISRFKFKRNEIDIFISDINCGIEYDGYFFHKNSIKKDIKKNIFFKNNNFNLIRVRHLPLKKISNLDVLVTKDELIKKDLNNIAKSILNFCNTNQKKTLQNYIKRQTFINEKSYKKYLSYFPSPIPQKSILSVDIKYTKEWNYKKNHPLKPEQFHRASHTKVWWKCLKGHEWKSMIKDRILQNQNCPYCIGKKISKTNNLQYLMPELSKEWHPTKNKKLKPTDVTKYSNKKVWWKCLKGHEWLSKISNRSNGNKCRLCSYSKRKKN